jgi:hypothetical protein
VPGLTLCRQLSPGRPGPPWRAKDLRSGYDVVIRELPDHESPEALTELLARLPDHPHLLAPTVQADASGRPMLVTRFAPHRGLHQLLTRRGGLSAAEVSTIGLAVGRALAALHATGVAHGGLSASAVLIGAEARPLLDASPMVHNRAAGSRPGDDVVALARLLTDALDASVPGSMSGVLLAASDPERPMPATELVQRLVAAVPPEPIRLVVPGTPVPSRPSRRRIRPNLSAELRRRLLFGVGALAGIALAVALGTVWAALSDGDGSAARRATQAATKARTTPVRKAEPSPNPSPGSVDWTSLLAYLDSRRAEAFASGDVDALSDVDAPGSAVLAGDLAALRQLAAAGVNASGFRQVLHSVRPLTVSTARVVLLVVDERPAYELVRAGDGTTVANRRARAAQTWQVELVLGSAGWQVASVRRA